MARRCRPPRPLAKKEPGGKVRKTERTCPPLRLALGMTIPLAYTGRAITSILFLTRISFKSSETMGLATRTRLLLRSSFVR